MCADEHPGLVLLEQRRLARPEQVDNGSLRAGSPMYFYCKGCGRNHAVLPESYLTPPTKFCNDCQLLLDEFVLDETALTDWNPDTYEHDAPPASDPEVRHG